MVSYVILEWDILTLGYSFQKNTVLNVTSINANGFINKPSILSLFRKIFSSPSYKLEIPSFN